MAEATCRKCGDDFSFTPGRGRRRIYCDCCSKRDTQRRYKARNPDKVLEAARRWRAENPERQRQLGRAWRLANADAMTAKAKRLWIEDRDRKQEWFRQWYEQARAVEANRQRWNAKAVAWQKANPEKVRQREARRRARKAGATVSDFTHQDWCELLRVFRPQVCLLRHRNRTP